MELEEDGVSLFPGFRELGFRRIGLGIRVRVSLRQWKEMEMGNRRNWGFLLGAEENEEEAKWEGNCTEREMDFRVR